MVAYVSSSNVSSSEERGVEQAVGEKSPESKEFSLNSVFVW